MGGTAGMRHGRRTGRRTSPRRVTFRPGLPPVDLNPAEPRAATVRLPVTGSPRGFLAPLTRVRVVARGFEPGEPVVLARCASEFGRLRADEACEPLDLIAGTEVLRGRVPDGAPVAGPDGTFTREVTAARRLGILGNVFTKDKSPPLPDEVDCTERPARCSIVVAAAADPYRSAVLPYTVTER